MTEVALPPTVIDEYRLQFWQTCLSVIITDKDDQVEPISMIIFVSYEERCRMLFFYTVSRTKENDMGPCEEQTNKDDISLLRTAKDNTESTMDLLNKVLYTRVA